MKTPEGRLREEWYTKTDIRIIFGVDKDRADRIFQNAHQRDEETVGRRFMYYYGKKVSRESALWATGKSFDNLLKALKSGATPAK